jgi:hypothetical protein
MDITYVLFSGFIFFIFFLIIKKKYFLLISVCIGTLLIPLIIFEEFSRGLARKTPYTGVFMTSAKWLFAIFIVYMLIKFVHYLAKKLMKKINSTHK